MSLLPDALIAPAMAQAEGTSQPDVAAAAKQQRGNRKSKKNGQPQKSAEATGRNRKKHADEQDAADKSTTKAGKAKVSSQQSDQPTKQPPAKDASTRRLDAIEQKLDRLNAALEKLTAEPAPAVEKEEPATQEAGTPTAEEATEQPDTPEGTQEAKVADRGKLPTARKLKNDWLEDIPWRSIGPANMSGRITDIAIHPQDPSLWWIATAGGGLLKTTNRGVTIEHQFENESTVSIGAIAADPTNKNVIWVGTGEANPRNSVSYGNGVYKSKDGGKTFEHLGLKETFQIGRICIDPKNPDTVYVGALGRLYGPNRERGVYKTTDGGKTWEHVLYVDDNTGVIDMVMHPENPNVLIAAMWYRRRDGFDSWPGSVKKPDGVDGYDPIQKYGADGGLYKTTDGGKKWTKLTSGLPSGKTGRIGLDWQSGGKHAIYAIIDSEQIGKGPKPFTGFLGVVGTDQPTKESRETRPVVTQLFPDCPAAKAGLKVGDVLQKVDDKDISKFDELLDILREKKIGDNISLVVSRGEETVTAETRVSPRPGSNQQMPSVWLGVTGEDKDKGALLKTVVKGGPAEKAGLKPGDVLLTVDGSALEGYRKLIELVQKKSDGDKLKLTLQRGDEEREITVTLANRPAQPTQQRSNAFMGIQGENSEDKGAKLTNVTSGGPSEKAGLKSGDVVVKVKDKEIADYAALIAEIRSRQPEEKMPVTVKRGEKSLQFEITLGDRRGSGDRNRPYTFSYFGQRANIQDQQGANGHEYGGIYKSLDAGETWQRVNSLNTRPMYFSLIRVDPSDDQRVYILGVSQYQSSNGGTTFSSDFGRGVHADGHDLWIDPADGRHMVIAGDGGFYATWDRGSNWDHVNTAAIGQFYHVAISPKAPYWVVGGLQDNGTWAGPAISRTGGAINEDWISVGGGDGFVCRVDPNDPDLMYFESQNGSIGRRHLKTGERASIRPQRKQGVEYRFNWNTPFILSGHNSKIFYSAGNYVFRSLDRGNNLQAISPEITLTKRGSATALSESPRNPNVLYVGTDDGALWVTRDGGDDWTNITANLGISDPRWVNCIEASRYQTGRVYVVLDAHRSDDDNPYVFVSEDYGQSFAPLHRGLPWGTTRCLREDITNQDLLYLGTELGFYVSIDRGQNWAEFNQELPKVAIHDVAIHPTNGEIVLATHGRSLWACDITALRALKTDTLAEKSVFYQPKDVIRWRTQPRRGRTNRRYVAENPPSGARLWYSLPEKAESVKLKISDIEGRVVREVNGSGDAGLHGVSWNLTRAGGSGGRAQTPGFRGTSQGRPVANGDYRITLVVDDKEIQSHTITLERDPSLPTGAVSDEKYEFMLMQDELRRQMKWDAKTEGRDVFSDD